LRNEKIGFKIREHTLQKDPYLLVVGDREVESQTLSIRARGGIELGTMTKEDFCIHLGKDIASYGRSET